MGLCMFPRACTPPFPILVSHYVSRAVMDTGAAVGGGGGTEVEFYTNAWTSLRLHFLVARRNVGVSPETGTANIRVC